MMRCPPGKFGVSEGLMSADCSGPCSPGHWCPAASIVATQIACPAGVFGNATGLKSPMCSDACPEGYYCPPGTSVPTLVCDEPSVYCPRGSGAPSNVDPGFYTVLSPVTGGYMDELECTPGTYCDSGVQMPCPAGRWGHLHREHRESCSGPCAKGHWCPAGSVSRFQRACPYGTYTSVEGSMSESDCVPCPDGSLCMEASVEPYETLV